MTGKIDMTVGEIQGHLQQLRKTEVTTEQRYALMAAIQTMSFMQKLSPGLRKAVEQHKEKKAETLTI